MAQWSPAFHDWRQVLAKNPQNESSDKDLEGIAELVTADKDMEDAIEALLKKDNLVWMLKSSSLSERKGQLFFLHHLSKLPLENNGGETTHQQQQKEPLYAALHGLSSLAQPLEISLRAAFEKVEIKAPVWSALKSIDSTEKALDTKAPSNKPSTYYVRQVQVLPPFLHKALMNSQDHTPAALLVEALGAMKAHDLTHANDKDFDKADVFCKSIAAFLWSAAQENNTKIKDIPLVIPSTNSQVVEWSKRLHEENIRLSEAATEKPLVDVAEKQKEEPEKSLEGGDKTKSNKASTETPPGNEDAANPAPPKSDGLEEGIERQDDDGGKFGSLEQMNAKPGASDAATLKPEDPEKKNALPDDALKQPVDEGKTKSESAELTKAADQRNESLGKETEDEPKSKHGSTKKVRTWEESFQRLLDYKARTGDCNVPREYAVDKALGEWVKNQRSVQKTLSKERRARLEEIGFTFSNTQQDRSNKNWEEKLQMFKASQLNGAGKAKAGDGKEDRALQHWMSVQRQNLKRGTLSDERKTKLDELGFVWTLKKEYKPRTKNDKQWQKGFDKLKEFHDKHKHCNVPKRPASNRPLWEWVYAQRKAYGEKRLPQDRIDILEELGMEWETDMGQVIRDEQWNKKHEEAKAFKEAHGHLEVPRSGKFGNTNLLKWMLRQREQYKNDKLCPSRKKLLDELGFDFEGHQKTRDDLLEQLLWKERYQELQKWTKEHGTAKVPESGPDTNATLVKWIAKQQVAYQFRDLDPSRKALLDELGVEFGEQVPESAAKAAKAGGSSSASGGDNGNAALGDKKATDDNTKQKDTAAFDEKTTAIKKRKAEDDSNQESEKRQDPDLKMTGGPATKKSKAAEDIGSAKKDASDLKKNEGPATKGDNARIDIQSENGGILSPKEDTEGVQETPEKGPKIVYV